MAKEASKKYDGQKFIVVAENDDEASAIKEMLELEGGQVIMTITDPEVALALTLSGKSKSFHVVNHIKRNKKKRK